MATREEIYTAIRNADAAGDSAAVRKLGDYLKTLPAEGTPPKPPVDHAARAAEFARKAADEKANAPGAGTTAARTVGGVLEGATNLVTGAVAAPVAGISGLLAGGARAVGLTDKSPADVVEGVQNAMTYSPRSEAGNAAVETASAPFRWFGNRADAAGSGVADATGSPLAGTIVNTAIQGLPAVLSPEVRSAFRGAGGAVANAGRSAVARVVPGVTPAPAGAAATAASAADTAAAAARAKAYVTGTANLDWDALSGALKAKLTDIARSAGGLDGLDPQALAREGRLQSLPVPVPATRGQITRNPAAMRREANVAATDEGAPIADTYQAANQALLDNLDVLKGKVSGTGKTAAAGTNAEDVGRAVQDAGLAAKQSFLKAKTKAAYDAARNSPEAQMPVDPEPLRQFLQDPINAKDTSPVMGLLRSFVPEDGGGITVANLERIRQKVQAAASSSDGTVRHAAGEAKAVIDQMMEGAGGDLYGKARAAHAAERAEFGDQGAVSKLVSDKAGTSDPKVAAENVSKTIAGGTLDDIRNVKRSLLTGGDTATRTAGRQAWREVRAQVIQQIKKDATKGVATMADGSPNLQPGALKSALDRIGPDRLNEIFGPGTARQLDTILKAAQDVKTMPASGGPPVGSTTFQNVLSFLGKGLDYAGKVPAVGPVVDAAVGAVRGAAKIGANAREARQATTTPLSEALATAKSRAARKAALERASGAAKTTTISALAAGAQNPR